MMRMSATLLNEYGMVWYDMVTVTQLQLNCFTRWRRQ